MLKTEYGEKQDDDARSKSRYTKDMVLNADVKKFHSTISPIGEGSKSQTRGKYNQLRSTTPNMYSKPTKPLDDKAGYKGRAVNL
jgi:hypothetical protein